MIYSYAVELAYIKPTWRLERCWLAGRCVFNIHVMRNVRGLVRQSTDIRWQWRNFFVSLLSMASVSLPVNGQQWYFDMAFLQVNGHVNALLSFLTAWTEIMLLSDKRKELNITGFPLHTLYVVLPHNMEIIPWPDMAMLLSHCHFIVHTYVRISIAYAVGFTTLVSPL